MGRGIAFVIVIVAGSLGSAVEAAIELRSEQVSRVDEISVAAPRVAMRHFEGLDLEVAVDADDVVAAEVALDSVVVDGDELDLRALLTGPLTWGQVPCTHAPRGAADFERVVASPDAVDAVDAVLPVVEGLEVLRRVASAQDVAQIPVIVITGAAPVERHVADRVELDASDEPTECVSIGAPVDRAYRADRSDRDRLERGQDNDEGGWL